jgi:hypothetical protein
LIGAGLLEIAGFQPSPGDSGEENHSFRRDVDHARSEATLAAFMLA